MQNRNTQVLLVRVFLTVVQRSKKTKKQSNVFAFSLRKWDAHKGWGKHSHRYILWRSLPGSVPSGLMMIFLAPYWQADFPEIPAVSQKNILDAWYPNVLCSQVKVGEGDSQQKLPPTPSGQSSVCNQNFCSYHISVPPLHLMRYFSCADYSPLFLIALNSQWGGKYLRNIAHCGNCLANKYN